MAKLTVDNGIVTKYSGNVTELIIPDGITEIADPKSFGDKGIFEGHTELTSVILPEGLLKIGESAFDGCSGLTEIVIPESVREIGRYAFKGCKGLKKIIIPKSVREISEHSFADCSGLLDITISDNTEIIGYSAFSDCSSLKKITIPQNITKIEGSAFSGCTGLISITFPESNITLGSNTFRDCTGLTDVTIPDCVKYYSDTFEGCRKITINGNDFSILDSILFNYAGTSDNVVIPDGVKTIGEKAFENHSEIISLTIPESVTKIEYSAFRGCTGLSCLLIPNTVTEIGNYAFEDCTGLVSISVSEKLTKISDGLFRNCSSLTNIVIPDNVTEIELSAFAGCDNLSEIKIPASVKKLDCGYSWKKPQKLNRIIIDPNSALETLWHPEQLLNNDYEISPLPNIPFSIINSPENKIKFFFEYCKHPESYPKHIADEYEKYGRSQRSRILREAEEQNRAEVIAYYEKKGKKAAVRTLTPAEKADLMKDAFEKGSDDDLLQVLNKYKNIGCESFLLEKAICDGKTSKIQLFLDHEVVVPERTNCFSEMIKSSMIPYDVKKTIIESCLAHAGSNISIDIDCIYEILTSSSFSHDEKNKIIELCLSHDLLRDPIDLCYAACVLNKDEVIETLKFYGKFPQFLPEARYWPYTSHYRLFSDLSAEQCQNALKKLLSLSDPNKRPNFYLADTNAAAIYHPENIRFIIDHFTIKWGNWPAETILNAVKNNQPESLKMVLACLEEKKLNMLDHNSDPDYIRKAIVECVSQQSNDMLEILYDTGWADPIVKKRDEYFHDSRGWKTKLFNDVISGGDPAILETLVKHGFLSELPSSFNKTNALRAAVEADNPGALEILSQQGWIKNASIRDSLIELASNEKKANTLAWLLEYKNKTSDPTKEEKSKERKERRALDSLDTGSVTVSDAADNKNKDLWKTHKNPDGTYTIDRYLGTENHLVIPERIGKRIITSIGKRSFDPDSYSRMKNNDIFRSDTSIVVTDGIKSIEDEAFYGFERLTSVVIPESVTTIGSDVFTRDIDKENDRLIIYGISGSYTEEYADKNNLRFVGIDPDENKIPDFAVAKDTLVAYNGNDKNPVIPDHVKAIGKSAFMGRKDIVSIILPEGLVSIGNNAFEDCSGISAISLPKSVTNIGDHAFSGCSGLTEITIPEKVVRIENSTFSGCNGLRVITLPEGLTSIGHNVFYNCRGLTNINIPESVKKIGAGAFDSCSAVKRITIPNGVLSIDYCTFENCSSLSEVNIPNGVTSIDWNAFKGCKGLKEINIPDSVKSIGESAFLECSGLNKIIIPNGVISIGRGAFSGCSGLTSVIIPDSVTSIGGSAFFGCSGLTDITIPGSVSKIGSAVFSNCSKLTDAVFAQEIKGLDLSIFSDCAVLERISIPSSIKSLSVKLGRWEKWPEKLTKIVIDPDAAIEKVDGAEELLEHEFEISPIRMIPISAIEEPETKLRYFFEYCKAPNQYPEHVAETYVKYGKSQRTRILREATAQNQVETIDYFEKMA